MGYIDSSITDNNGYYQSFFTDTDYICHYLYNGLITLSYKSESNLRIRVLQNVFWIYFHFYI